MHKIEIRSLYKSYQNGAASLEVYDVIVMPTDEWAGEFTPAYASIGQGGASNEWTYLDVDSVNYPKRDIRALLREYATDGVISQMRPVANGPAILQANADQKLWMFNLKIGGVADWAASISTGGSIQVLKTQRYLSMRGAR